eukprot:scaffold9053_cov86-Isochrysis_galbana.AAC.4
MAPPQCACVDARADDGTHRQGNGWRTIPPSGGGGFASVSLSIVVGSTLGGLAIKLETGCTFSLQIARWLIEQN